MTISGRSARCSAAAAARSAPSPARGVATASGAGAAWTALPANMRAACRFKYQRSARSASALPLPAASAYHCRIDASSYNRSTGHSRNTGPGTPEAASAMPSASAGARSRTRRRRKKRLTCGVTSGRWSISCSAPRPCSAVGAAPPSSSSGDCASCAFFSAVIVFVMPGPAVTAATPGRPASRACASAAKTAVASSRVSTMRMPRALAAARIGEMWPPHNVKIASTPCACSASAMRSPP